MTRFKRTLSESVSEILGDAWRVECPDGWDMLIATHANGSSAQVWLSREDGRRNATTDDARDYVARLRRFLRGEVSKYTEEWAEKARRALEDMPELVTS